MQQPVIVSIFGSPHKNGFTSSIHNALLRPFCEDEYTLIAVNAFEVLVSPCIACGNCHNSPECVHDDAMTGLYEKLMSCSLIIVSSPVYFSGLSAPLKMIIDRCQLIWEHPSLIIPKKAVFISSAGSDYKRVFDGSLLTIKHFFNTLKASYEENDFLFQKGSDSVNIVPADLMELAENTGRRYRSLLAGDGLY